MKPTLPPYQERRDKHLHMTRREYDILDDQIFMRNLEPSIAECTVNGPMGLIPILRTRAALIIRARLTRLYPYNEGEP